MFQSFDSPSSPKQGPRRLALLRRAMEQAGVDAFLVPRADAHQGEYVAARDDRLAWLTGFTGSAGFAVATADRAAVFVDGRYRVQVRAQVDAVFEPVNWPETKLADWLRRALPDGGRGAFDAWLHTPKEVETLRAALTGSGISVEPCENLIDAIWEDQPAPPLGPIVPQPLEYAGEAAEEKRNRLGRDLASAGQRAAVLTLPDSIAWLLNIRGSDIPRNPVPHAFAILHDGGEVDLFTDPRKVDDALRTHLGNGVRLHAPDGFLPALRALQGPVRVDWSSAPVAVADALAEAGISWGDDPCALPKACKTPAEIAGTREAHLRDGAAMCRFLAWFDGAQQTQLTEKDLVIALEGFRRDTNALREISFDTIAGAGPNGALPHYRVTDQTNRALSDGDLIVVDSGGQYLDGTTDITRTLAVGTAGAEERACFTRVLKGMIAISRLRFPRGLAGQHLDSLARYPLWLAGLDYDHGTGHGVGAYLCVHEGPQRLSRVSDVALRPGMILSNEPGYYREGAFGIRIENLIVVQEAGPLPGADDRAMLEFETLTWVPIDRRLIEPNLLSQDERDWIDDYHALCRDKLSPRLDEAVRLWLEQATEPL